MAPLLVISDSLATDVSRDGTAIVWWISIAIFVLIILMITITILNCDCCKKQKDQNAQVVADNGAMEGRKRSGVDTSSVYEEIFTNAPEVMKFFPAILNASQNSEKPIELRDIASFRNQALRLVDVMAYGVNACQDLSGLEDRLQDLGRRHRMYLDDELTKDHFKVIQQSTLTVISARLDQCADPEKELYIREESVQKMMTAWTTLMGFIISQIYKGYKQKK